MLIKKLYTLSQFVDLLYDNAAKCTEFTRLVKKYNDFLKQSIKKEMFVNETPIFGYSEGDDGELERIEVEKKVIFKDVDNFDMKDESDIFQFTEGTIIEFRYEEKSIPLICSNRKNNS